MSLLFGLFTHAPSFAQMNALPAGSILIDSRGSDLPSQSDLVKLADVFRNKRVVFLGEATHGDGTALKLKSRLINYLITEHRFDVVLFERNIYEMDVMRRFLAEGGSHKEYVLQEGFRTMHRVSTGLDELMSSRGEILLRKSSLMIGGVDPLYFGRYGDYLERDLADAGIRSSLIRNYMRSFKELMILQDCYSCSSDYYGVHHASYSTKFEQQTAEISRHLHLSKGTATSRKNFLLFILKGNIDMFHWLRDRGSLQDHPSLLQLSEFFAGREKIMAANLLWYLQNYPNSRIVVSASTFHVTRGVSPYTTMVDHLPDSMHAQAGYFPIVYYDGAHGYVEESYAAVDSVKRSEGSIEYFLSSQGFDFAFLRLDNLESEEKSNLVTYSLHPSELLPPDKEWSKTYDGIFFIKSMKPDTLHGVSLQQQAYIKALLSRRN